MLNRSRSLFVALLSLTGALLLGGAAHLPVAVAAAPDLVPAAPAVQPPPVAPAPIAADDVSANPVAPAQATPGGHLRIAGWVTSTTTVDAQTRRLVCATLNGTFEVDAGTETEVRAEDGAVMAVSDLTAGMRVQAAGLVGADARIDASSIVAAQAPATGESGESTIRGRIIAALEGNAATDGRNLIVVAAATGEVTVEVDAGTTIVGADGSAAAFADLTTGQAVTISARGEGDVVLRAETVQLLEPERPSRVTFEGVLRARAALDGGGERWIVGQVAVDVRAEQAGSIEAAVGEQVRVSAQRGPDGALVALSVEAVVAAAETIELRGTVEAVGEGELTVDGLTIQLDGETTVDGQLEVGAFVAITATLEASGQLRAETVDVRAEGEVEVQFEGTIEAVGLTEWTVDGTTVQVDALATTVTGLAPAPGLHAEVTGALEDDGAVSATRIHVQADLTGGLEVLECTLVEVSEVPGTWRIEIVEATGATVELDLLVTAETVIDESAGAARAGAEAQVRAEAEADSSLTAELIRIRGGS